MGKGTHTRGGWGMLFFPFLLLCVAGYGVWHIQREAVPIVEKKDPALLLHLSFTHLPALPKGHYELWERRADGAEQRLATFRILEGGSLVTLAGDPLATIPLSAPITPHADILVTVEENDVPLTTHSSRVVLQGTFHDSRVNLSFPSPKTSQKSVALLAVPGGAEKVQAAGIWFAKSVKPLAPGITLPKAPDGWLYGGWVITGAGTPLPTGFFADPGKQDMGNQFTQNGSSFALPGEAFQTHPPKNIHFPLSLNDGKEEVVVSLEPDFVRPVSDAPYLPLLRTRIPYQQSVGQAFTLASVSPDTFPTGDIEMSQ